MHRKNKGNYTIYSERPNVHIAYDQEPMPYHRTVASLVGKYGKESANLLDIGCGVGHTLSETRRLRPDFRLYIADIDDEVLNITKARVDIVEAFLIKSVDDLLEPGLLFDIVIMSHVLEHTYRPLDVLNTVKKLITPNGIMVLAVPNPVRFRVIINNLRQKNYVNRGHVYAWDRSHWINFLENIANLNVIEYSQDFSPLHRNIDRFQAGRRFEVWLAKLFPWFALSNIAVIRV